MFKFEFSMWGIFIVILLFLTSFILNWVIAVNFKNKYSNIKSEYKKNAVKFSKEYLDINNIEGTFKTKKSGYWSQDINSNIIYVDRQSYFSNSIYNIEKELFKTIIYIKKNNWWYKNQVLIKVLIFMLTILLSISLIFMFLFGLLISTSILVMIFAIDSFNWWQFTKKSLKQEKWLLRKLGFHSKDICGLLRIRKISFINKYISAYSESLISLALLFKSWGENG